jgi:hypothetical protein
MSLCLRYLLIVILLSVLGLMLVTPGAQAQTQVPPDPRFSLQCTAGPAAYTILSNAVSLAQVRPLFATITAESADYIQGDYLLAGRNERVGLIIGQAGWILAYLPVNQGSEYLYDCRSVSSSQPGNTISRPELAIQQIAAALEITNTSVSFYDFRYPQATGVTQHWNYLYGSGTQESSIELPLTNTYLERGYAFCTALANSEFWLNDALVDEQDAITQIIYRYGKLTEEQLRAGQNNALRIQATSLFGRGFLGGVSTVYSGTTTLTTTGGYSRTLQFVYPSVLGPPLTIYQAYLPLVRH